MSKIKREKAKAKREQQYLKKAEEKRKIQEELEEVEPEEEEQETDAEEADDDDSEPVKKDMEDAMPMPDLSFGPTSFEELDAQRAAEEQAQVVRQTTWDVQDLVRNILNDPFMALPEKTGAIQAVAGGFEQRLMGLMAGESDDLQKDLDVLQIEALLGMEARSRSLIEKGKDYVTDLIKRKLSPAGRKQLSGEDFALPEKKKYPIHDKAHVRNALARAAQQIKGGGEGAADAKAALSKIRTAAKKFGIDVSMEKGIHIEKDAKGDWRWIGRPSNNFIDHQSDIISKSAHQKYMTWLDANPGLAPVFCSWHIPGTARTEPVDFWMEHEGAVIMSGKLTETEAARLLSIQKEVDLGMSFQGDGLRLNPDDPRVITDYWMYEVSDLPLDKAANPFTSLETITKEVGMDKLEYLTKMMGSREKAEAYLKNTGQMQKDLQAAGITSKAKDDAVEVKAQVETPAAPAVPTPDVNALIAQITKAMRDEFDIDGLNAFVAQAQEDHEKVEVLEGLIKTLQASRDDELAETLTPPVARFAWSVAHRASADDGTKLKKGEPEAEDEKLEKSMPGVSPDYWLSQVTGTTPIPMENR